ncbi:MAG: phosphatidate cytidylyltransferase [Zoogloeaceae bacterium]|jgi:phosphatidate cytidylyltransferase|nr:phosphatidate cytidylyltransferase [Zoogloeaceae bacterium]
MLKTRVLTAAVLFALFLAALSWLPLRCWAGLTALAAAVAAWEWAGLASVSSRGRFMFAAIVLLACLGMEATLARALDILDDARLWLYLAASFFWCFVVPFWLWRRWPLNQNVWGRGLLLFLGFFLILTWAAAFVDLLHKFEPGGILLILGVVWVSDISAYFSERGFGGKKLAPQISPDKTWASVYGALAAPLVCAFIPTIALSGSLSPSFIVCSFTLILAVFGILGDLFESLLKRQAGVKDSGSILPGHGGVLDRIDSQMALLPCVIPLFMLYGSFLGPK